MTTEKALAKVDILETVLVRGDLSSLTGEQRLSYYKRVCESIGLNPLTRPFDYIVLNGKLTLYARRDATDQLRDKKKVSITITAREFAKGDGLYIVTAKATTPEGRTDESTGAVAIEGKRGDDLANACMKAETKAKRRVTLSICGLGLMDETEAETVAEATPVTVDSETGEIVRPTPVTAQQPEHGAEVICRVCGIKGMTASQYGRDWYHYTGDTDGKGKRKTHKQPMDESDTPQPTPAPAQAPATKPEAPAGVVVAPASVGAATGRQVLPKSIAELMQRAKEELGLPFVEAKRVLGIKEPLEIGDLNDAWVRLCVAAAKAAKP